MKIVKGISLFLIYPFLLLVTGFYIGMELTRFFYPGGQHLGEEIAQLESSAAEVPSFVSEQQEDADVSEELPSIEVAAAVETLNVDTTYVLMETDTLKQTVVEIIERLPHKYVGMDREQFLLAMETYEALPPLSEQERGFVSLDVLSFSAEKVVVQMNYQYIQPSTSFYLAVYNNQVIVYLDDKKTVYIETEIMLDTLPEDIQLEIIDMLWIEDEEKLYNFLENYSS